MGIEFSKSAVLNVIMDAMIAESYDLQDLYDKVEAMEEPTQPAITEQQALNKIAERFPVGTDQLVKMLESTEALSKQDKFCAPHSYRSQIGIEELIDEKIEEYKMQNIHPSSGLTLIDEVIADLKQLKSSLPTQPELLEVPEFVAEYIKYVKKKGRTLKESLSPFELYGVDYLSVGKWIKVNEDIFARAWLDGYTVKKEPRIHKLKIQPKYYDDVISGVKTFEIRKNDRNYMTGDILLLQEYKFYTYSGNECKVKVTYITDYAQQEGYVVMGIVPFEWSSDLEEEAE